MGERFSTLKIKRLLRAEKETKEFLKNVQKYYIGGYKYLAFVSFHTEVIV